MKIKKYDITLLLGDIKLKELFDFTDFLDIVYKLNSFIHSCMYI